MSGTLFNVNKNTAALYFHRLLELIAYHREQEARDIFDGEIEVDESYFGGMQKGKQGRGAAGKVTVFGLLKHGGKVYTQVIADTKSTTLVPIIRQKTVPDSVFYSDCLRACNSLETQDFQHFPMNHSKLFAEQKNHINGIKNFWNRPNGI